MKATLSLAEATLGDVVALQGSSAHWDGVTSPVCLRKARRKPLRKYCAHLLKCQLKVMVFTIIGWPAALRYLSTTGAARSVHAPRIQAQNVTVNTPKSVVMVMVDAASA